MERQENKRLSFIGDWFQKEADIRRMFYIYFYPSTSSIEIYDYRSKKIFLRKIELPELRENDFFIGNKLCVHGRMIKILDYGDNMTRESLENTRKRALIIIKPEVFCYLGDILHIINENKLFLKKGKMIKLGLESAMKLLHKTVSAELLRSAAENFASSAVIAFELLGLDTVNRLKNIIGPEDSTAAKENYPNCLRARFGEDISENAVYISQTESEAINDLDLCFGQKHTAIFSNTTLCVIKPHAIKAGKLGPILSDIISNGFQITALRMDLLDKENCDEFLEVYKGVSPLYGQMVAELSSGICMAIELVINDPNKETHSEFRKFCGPNDPEIARKIRPQTLRAKYGKDELFNAIHCTDLPEDVTLDVEYFFKILP